MLFCYTSYLTMVNLHIGGDGRYTSRIQWTPTPVSSDTGKYLPTKGGYFTNFCFYKWAILGKYLRLKFYLFVCFVCFGDRDISYSIQFTCDLLWVAKRELLPSLTVERGGKV